MAVFLDRAARVRPGRPPTPADLQLIADIVRRLDGMPLAIELAAGRLSSFSLADLHRRLDRSLDLLGGGRPSGDARHRTLRATIEWSYELLPEDERKLFRHLSVFVDGVDLDAAERLATELGAGQRSRQRAGPPGRCVDDRRRSSRPAPGTACWRRCGRSASTGSRRPARTTPPTSSFAQLGGRLTAWIGADVDHRTRAGGGRGAAPGAAEPAGRLAAGPRPGDRSTTRRRSSSDCSTRSPTGTWSRSGAGPRSWPTTRPSPHIRGPPRCSGTAAEAAYHRGDYAAGRAARPQRSGAARPTTPARGSACRRCRWPHLARGAYADVVEHALAAADAHRRPGENLASPPWRRPTPVTSTRRGTERAWCSPPRCRPRMRVLGRLRRRRDRIRRRPTGSGRAAVRRRDRTGPRLGRNLPGRRRHGRAADGPGGHRPDPRGADRVPRRHRLLRPHRQLDPSVGHPAEPGRPAAPARRRRAGDTAGRRRRPGSGRTGRQPIPATPGRATDPIPGRVEILGGETSDRPQPDSGRLIACDLLSPADRRTTLDRPTRCSGRPTRRSSRPSGSVGRPAHGPCGPRCPGRAPGRPPVGRPGR